MLKNDRAVAAYMLVKANTAAGPSQCAKRKPRPCSQARSGVSRLSDSPISITGPLGRIVHGNTLESTKSV
jgi:hypothetical protein